MRRLQSAGVGSKKKQAEVLTEEDEELLWQKGLLGDATPQTLVDTMVYMNGLYFALQSGKEHRQLRSTPCQIEVIEKEGERPYLKYTEDISKNHPGGLRGRKMKQKVVIHHANQDHPERCIVRLFKRYLSLMAPNCPADAFYLQPSRHPTSTCWFSATPLGHYSLGRTISRICKEAGIGGYKTNHSLRATAATRLYQSGVDEQLVMERTGHRSLEGVRSYKRTSDTQCQALSDILNCSKKTRTDSSKEICSVPTLPPVASSTSSIQNNIDVSNTIPGTFYFHSCQSVTINMHTSSK